MKHNGYILVVEDDLTTQTILKRFLEHKGYLVKTTDSAEEAFFLIKDSRPDLVLLDLVLGEDSGFWLIDEVRRELKSDNPIVVLSSLKDRESVVTAATKGANDYIVKPIDPVILFGKISKNLRNRRTLSYTPNEKWKIRFSISCNIVQSNSIGVLVELPVKIGPNSALQINDFAIMSGGTKELQYIKTAVPPRLVSRGIFLNEVKVVGL